jgi:diguanylate cyclase (GGDEF)-like protein/PAS domain S-box-containing protein
MVSSELAQIKMEQAKLQERFDKIANENRRLKSQFDSTAKQVRELNDFIQLILNLSPFGICILQDNKIIFTNKAFSDIFGFSTKQLRNSDPLKIVFEGDREHVKKSILTVIKDKTESFFMFRTMTGNETIKWILGSIALIHMNEKRAILGNFVDLTEGRVMQMAYNDPLTGLPNRKLMMDRLEQAIVSAKRRNDHLALLFVDLDEFKDINDTYGHDAGDQLLMEIAENLRDVVRRENDTIARFGGDEFLILLTDIAERSHVETIVQLLFEKFARPLSIGFPPLEIRVKLSIGIAIFPDHGESSDTLIHHADTAMYKVKKEYGKNNFHFFDG